MPAPINTPIPKRKPDKRAAESIGNEELYYDMVDILDQDPLAMLGALVGEFPKTKVPLEETIFSNINFPKEGDLPPYGYIDPLTRVPTLLDNDLNRDSQRMVLAHELRHNGATFIQNKARQELNDLAAKFDAGEISYSYYKNAKQDLEKLLLDYDQEEIMVRTKDARNNEEFGGYSGAGNISPESYGRLKAMQKTQEGYPELADRLLDFLSGGVTDTLNSSEALAEFYLKKRLARED